MKEVNVMLRKDTTSKKFSVTAPKDTILKATIDERTNRASVNVKSILYITVSPKDYVICKTEKGMVQYHRKPNTAEIKFGEGATHYMDIPESVCRKQNGDLKKWLVYNGEKYYY